MDNIIAVLLILLYGIIGGGATISLTIGLPAILVWKCYRKIKYHIPFTM